MNKRLIGLCFLYLLLGLAVMKAYLVFGVGWDFTAHYISGRYIFSQGFFKALKEAGVAGTTSMNFGIVETKSLYFEFYRAPLSILILGTLSMLAGTYAIPAYLALMVLLLLIATVYLSKSMGIDYLLLGSLVALPYLVIFPFMVNSEEMLSLSLMMLSLALLRKGRWQSGLVMGLACLSKYTALIFFPILILAGDRKKIAYSYIALFLVTMPWLLFNYAAFGNPFFSYLSSIRVSLESTMSSSFSAAALASIMAGFVPAVLALAVIYSKYAKKRISGIKKNIRNAFKWNGNKDFLLIFLFLMLAALEFLILGIHESAFDQSRYGYFLFFSSALIFAYLISARIRTAPNKHLKPAIYFLLFAFSAIAMLATIFLIGSHSLEMSYGNADPVFANASGAINGLGIENCSVVSNDWVFLRYYGIKAFSPFSSGKTLADYPAVVFNGIGVSANSIKDYNSETTYKYINFGIYLPHNYSC